jgi:hypothetical protein
MLSDNIILSALLSDNMFPDNIMLSDDIMIRADNIMLSDNMLWDNIMIRDDKIMLSDNMLSYFFSLKIHTLVSACQNVGTPGWKFWFVIDLDET